MFASIIPTEMPLRVPALFRPRRMRGWAGALLLLLAGAEVARAGERLDVCHQVASQCLAAGGDDASCRREVDKCMSEHACEEVYYSCLELMELEETLTEQDCKRKRTECIASRKR